MTFSGLSFHLDSFTLMNRDLSSALDAELSKVEVCLLMSSLQMFVVEMLMFVFDVSFDLYNSHFQ